MAEYEKQPLISDRTPDYKTLDSSASSRSSDAEVPKKEESIPWTRVQKLTAFSLALMNFAFSVSFSVIGPFFPSEAEKKGASATEVGLIFGIFNLVIFITSPLYGHFIDRIGAKYMFLSGSAVMGGCNILFGFLDMCPDGPIYVLMCFVVRIVESNGTSMMATASFAIMAKTFSKNVGAAMGSLELFSGVGMIIGPSIGGGLYSWGGYRLPFIVVGSVVLCNACLSVFVLPSINDVEKFDGSILSLLKIPGALLMYLIIISGSMALTLLDPTFSPYMLKTFKQLTVGQVGLIFMTGPGIYMFSAPLAGWVSDRGQGKYQGQMIVIGTFICGVSFLFIGPSSVFKYVFSPNLAETIVALGVMGLGVGFFFIPAFPLLLRILKNKGFTDGLRTYGLVSGFFNSAFALGGFIGPTAAGAVTNSYGFPITTAVSGIFQLFIGVLMMAYIIIMKCMNAWPIPVPNEEEMEETNKPQDVST